MSRQRPMEIPYAILHAAYYLRDQGFLVLPAKRKSTSKYLMSRGFPFKIRVSDHPVKRRSPDVLMSIIIKEPMTAKDIERRCKVGLHEFHGRISTRIAASCSALRNSGGGET